MMTATEIAKFHAAPHAGLMIDSETYLAGECARIAFAAAEAERVADIFRAVFPGATVAAEQIGDACYGERGWEVSLQKANRRAGNQNLFRVPAQSGIDEKAAKKIVKAAKAEWAARDNGSFARAAAERAVDAE